MTTALVLINTVLLITIGLLLRHYLPGYLSKKGENLATKEDITEITEKVEEVRSAFAAQQEALSHKYKLRLAALDRRLEVHQQAYTKWWKLFHSVHGDEVGKVVNECQDWWVQHCVYLSPEVREAFLDAFHAAHQHSTILRSSDSEHVYENWNKIENCGRLILQNAGLPGFGTNEASQIRSQAERSSADED